MPYVVDIMEHDSYTRLDDRVTFDTREEAIKYTNEYNNRFNSDPNKTSSDWSMYAKFEDSMYPKL